MSRKALMTFVALAVLLAPAAGRGQDGGGGTRSIFTLGAGSRAIAMGGAFTAIGDDPSVIYYNPAALKLNGAPRILANHIQLFSGFGDATYDFLGLAYPTVSAGSFGIGFMTAGTGGIREFDDFSRETGEISYRESQAILGYAFGLPWRYIGRFTLGSSVKILNQRVGDFSDTGTGLDLGILYEQDYIKNLVIGCNIQDFLGAETKLVSVSEKVYRTIMFGVGYSYLFQGGSKINLSMQVDFPEKDDKDLRFGVEYDYRSRISFRLGYDSESITAGVGFAWRGYGADYGFFTREEAGTSHPISISARIGMPVVEKIRVRNETRAAEEERLLRDVFSRRVSRHIAAADSLRMEGNLNEALDEIKIALEFDPSNETATRFIEEVGAEILRLQQERTSTAEKALLINQHFSLGLRYYSNNEYILARAEWRNVLELDPENTQALEYLDRTEEKLAEQVEQHRIAAREHERLGRLAEAIGEWNTVRMIDPENQEARTASERISRRLNELNRDYRAANTRLMAIEQFEDALTAFSAGRYGDAVELLNALLEKQPDHEEARKLLRRAQRRMTPLTDEEKNEIRRLYIEGMKNFTKKDFNAAIEIWRRILEIDPDNESVRKNIEEAEQRIRKLESSEAE